ncbi:prolipoprotein diacylglyceryl transferase [Plesiocystis pacifica SIR-1]|uniref:Phosphatidylglycerol--prolipoprotein diacylglyceryl transferase n=1 Tax=Plesiocystis pacifica SIR-1 TaxID=391625 RepID=A6G827_9BACT|nr:prolipoprotein diacylglyceryl transferase family protein [Plesiocystis pacifica]EDM77989.1 prolipoprotein diacylglyceryl transferase [Plesiocystis pacifica SIR-1]
MYPDKIPIFGDFGIAPYGIMVATGLLLAIIFGGRENERIKLMTPELWEKVALWTVIWGLLASRMLYVLTELDRFMAGPAWKLIALWEGGLVFYGGPLGAVGYLIWHFVIRRHPPTETEEVVKEIGPITMRQGWTRMLRFFDLGAPFLALAHAFGRIGCVFAGCCYGAAHEGPFSLHYPEAATGAHIPGGMGRYPIPMVESVIEFSIFVWLYFYLTRNKKFHGQVMLHYVILYPIARFVLEMFRGDAVRGYVFEVDTAAMATKLGLDPSVPLMMTTSQFISLFVVGAAIVLIFVGRKASADGPIADIEWAEAQAAADEEEDDDEEDDDEDEGEDAADESEAEEEPGDEPEGDGEDEDEDAE